MEIKDYVIVSTVRHLEKIIKYKPPSTDIKAYNAWRELRNDLKKLNKILNNKNLKNYGK